MDAKSKARFINSVAGGQVVPCPSCNNINPPGSVFCRACGTRLQAPEPEEPEEQAEIEAAAEVICPVCNAVLAPDAVFCSSCGTRITGADAVEKNEEYTAADSEEYTAAGSEEYTAEAEEEYTAAVNEEYTAPINDGPAFRPVQEAPRRSVQEAPRRPVQKRTLNFAVPEEETAVEVSVFAQGLPEWDVVPPQVLVRRVKK